MKRASNPYVSSAAEQLLAQYRSSLEQHGTVEAETIRNYLSDLRQFMAWCETSWQNGLQPSDGFRIADLTTPLVAQYRAYLLTILQLKPTSCNRMLISIKRLCAWATERNMLASDPARAVPLTVQPDQPPRFLTDAEEQRLLATVAALAPPRDQAIVILLLRAGLRVQELCALPSDHVDLSPSRGGSIQITGVGARGREVPLDALARDTVALYVPTRPAGAIPFFVGARTDQSLTTRTVGRIVSAYAARAQLAALSPQDLRNRCGYRLARTLPLPEVARRLGHRSLASALRYVAVSG